MILDKNEDVLNDDKSSANSNNNNNNDNNNNTSKTISRLLGLLLLVGSSITFLVVVQVGNNYNCIHKNNVDYIFVHNNSLENETSIILSSGEWTNTTTNIDVADVSTTTTTTPSTPKHIDIQHNNNNNTDDFNNDGLDISTQRRNNEVDVFDMLQQESSSSQPDAKLTYYPGKLTVQENGMNLSQGLQSKVIATSLQKVLYSNGQLSSEKFHNYPDGAATFVDPNPNNIGGWIYVTNSEYRFQPNGGVGAITFNKYGNITNYQMLLNNTRGNCGGGTTPWGTWISCEEFASGRIWQVDPTGTRKPERITMGNKSPGPFEAFAYDDRNLSKPRFFATKDSIIGEVTRFTPDKPNWNEPWTILTGRGTNEYLVLQPKTDNGGTYRWTKRVLWGKVNGGRYFPWSEGIDRRGNELYFISKRIKKMFILNLDSNTYTVISTVSDIFNDQPDQVRSIIGSNTSDVLYFTEDGDNKCGVHARNSITGQYYTILQSNVLANETSGFAFSPDNKHMYIAYQREGKLFDITRTDKKRFDSRTVGIQYHIKK